MITALIHLLEIIMEKPCVEVFRPSFVNFAFRTARRHVSAPRAGRRGRFLDRHRRVPCNLRLQTKIRRRYDWASSSVVEHVHLRQTVRSGKPNVDIQKSNRRCNSTDRVTGWQRALIIAGQRLLKVDQDLFGGGNLAPPVASRSPERQPPSDSQPTHDDAAWPSRSIPFFCHPTNSHSIRFGGERIVE
ncbi:hypothetical protein EVAR_10425_1 [Eumeta japonica]|uniref:Uncharacterized protein n=1 Tax=Eumeta variegata TaxID=151549 RepID=A0A4C1UCU5_EUMVA|nr:hypothetical protein EVAR_10425_1 [Eumeta japonica]